MEMRLFEQDSALYIGTSSWSHKSWQGVFYPQQVASRDFISHYSTIYDCVEIDATFYAIPTRSTVEGWRERTPEGFRFAAKVPRVITHDKVLQDAEQDIELFVETMQLLGDRLGPLLLQFPYFNKKTFDSAGPFLDLLDQFLESIPAGPRYVVEVRNRNWIGPELQQLLSGHKVALAWVDQAWMPDPEEWPRRVTGPTTDFGYFRFLGDRKAIDQITRTWDRQVVDRRDRLARWLPVMKQFRESAVEVFGFFNNHYAGHAPATVEDFRSLWSGPEGHSSSSSK
ncbi:MAG: hypothetical protein DSY81_08455 [Bacillota bacterium]|jgi:uncharacterized protein YecE (DUF72 family)|nr:MAG: hypothetical protein DSY92_06525 [Planctomycetota bacterium]RUA08776.1 MAG: hypothetical protein DSY81_08455 [Bacillota bacterium]